MPWKRPSAFICALILTAVLAAACSGGGGKSSYRQPASTPTTQARGQLAPGKLLQLSAERTQQVSSFRGTFMMTMSAGASGLKMSGDYQFQAPDKFVMTIDMLGQQMRMLYALPNMYMEVPGEGWYVVNANDVGVDWEAFKRYAEQRGPLDYSSTIGQLTNPEQLSDEVLDGKIYAHYRGTLDLAKMLNDLPAGIVDPSVAQGAAQMFSGMTVNLWLDKDTNLPYRMDMNMQLNGEAMGAAGKDLSMDMSMRYTDYNGPVDIPTPPADAKPLSQLNPSP